MSVQPEHGESSRWLSWRSLAAHRRTLLPLFDMPLRLLVSAGIGALAGTAAAFILIFGLRLGWLPVPGTAAVVPDGGWAMPGSC